jgi:peptidoglycan/xylan/chitin deacetylase (PgdA/CDA1 family)
LRVKVLLRGLAFALLRYSGIPFLLREVVQTSKVTILVYHAPPADRARDHFRALAARYNIIRLADYLRAREAHALQRLPPKSLVITLDDGHRSNYELKPVLEELGIPVTVFLCSGLVGTHRHFWWNHTASPSETQGWKRLPEEDRLQNLLRRGYSPDNEYPDRQALSDEEIAELKPWVDFQAHTVTHPILPACSDETATREIESCKADLESRYDLRISSLAFPNGDYTEREVALLRKAGYTCALTLDHGFNGQYTDLFSLRRVPLPDDASVDELLVKASGLWGLLQPLRSLWSRSQTSSLRRRVSHGHRSFRNRRSLAGTSD